MTDNNAQKITKNLKTNIYTYKSSDLIESSYELTLAEQRLVSLACKKLQPIYIENKMRPDDFESVLAAIKFSDMKITVDEYRKEYNIKGNGIYSYIEDTANQLFEREISYYNKENMLVRRRWVSNAKYSEKESCIYLTFDAEMAKDLLVFKGKYVALFFDLSQNTKSKYAFRLYEILKNNAYPGSYKVSLENIKFMLAIDGYPKFGEFNRSVITPNIKAINAYSDIIVGYDLIREGRTVVGFDFKIKSKLKSNFMPRSNFNDTIPKAYKEITEALAPYNIKLNSVETERIFTSATDIIITNKMNIDAVSYIISKIKLLKVALMSTDITYVPGFIDWMVKTDYNPEDNFIQKQSKKLKFDNFEGRNHDENYYNDLEKRLLGWDDEVAISEEDYKQEKLWD